MDEKEIQEMKDKLEAAESANATLVTEKETLQAENVTLKETPEPEKQTPDGLDQQTIDALEKKYNKPIEEIQGMLEIANLATAPLAEENRKLRAELIGGRAEDKIKDSLSKDRDFGKLEKHYDSFMADVPEADRSDKVKLEAWSKKAVSFAKGEVGFAQSGESEVEPIGDDIDNEVAPVKKKEEEYFAQHKPGPGMKLNLNIEKLVDDEYRGKNMHPFTEGAVQIDEKAEFVSANPRTDRVKSK